MPRAVKCPICRTQVLWHSNPYRPFCSARCRTIDLGAWAGESYRIPGDWIDQSDVVDRDKEEPPGEGS